MAKIFPFLTIVKNKWKEGGFCRIPSCYEAERLFFCLPPFFILRWINLLGKHVKVTFWLLTFISAFGYLVSPHANASFTVVSKSGTALIPGSFTVPAIPENVALFLISENTVKTRAMGSSNWRFELCSLATFNVVQVVAVLGQEFRVRRVERKTVTACFKFRNVVVAFPVLVARCMMRIETKVIGTFESLLCSRSCDTKKKDYWIFGKNLQQSGKFL